MGSSDRPSPKDVALGEPREATPIPPALQVIHPPDRSESQPDMHNQGQDASPQLKLHPID